MSDAPATPDSEDERNLLHKKLTKSCRVLHPDKNPCLEAQELSYKCLNDNDFDHEKCKDYFMNYKNCRKFWHNIVKERRRQRVKPHMPPMDERAAYQLRFEKEFGHPQ